MYEHWIVSCANILTASFVRRLFVTRTVSRRMQKVYFRFSEGSDTFQISLNVKDDLLGLNRQFNFSRKASENVGSLLSRINTNLDKVVAKKEKKKKKKRNSTTENDQSECSSPEISSKLLKNGLPISEETVCQDVLLSACGLTLQICDTTYSVVINAPWIDSLSLPTTIMAEFPVYPNKFKNVFSERSMSIFSWYRGNRKDNDWKKVGDDYYYKPTIEDIGYFLKFECIPGNDEVKGPLFDVISKDPVEAGPGICPFETRHLFTSQLLNWPNFRVVSYNILADLYADSDVARNQLYPYCPAYALGIDYRKQLILKEIMGYNSDIICLQEVDEKVYANDLVPYLENLKYGSVFGKKGGQVAEGLACFYHQSKFKAINSYNICLANELFENPIFSHLWERLKNNSNLITRFKERTTCLLVTVLQSELDAKEVLLVGNTHLYFHPDADHIRLLQAGMVVRYLEHLQAELIIAMPDVRISVIMCGDFNSTPDCGVYQLMTTQWVSEHYKDWKSNEKEAIQNISLSHSMLLQSACGTPEITNFTVGFYGCLDYIFYQNDQLSVTQVIPFPSTDELKQHTALPSVVFPSDHVALVCDLELLKGTIKT